LTNANDAKQLRKEDARSPTTVLSPTRTGRPANLGSASGFKPGTGQDKQRPWTSKTLRSTNKASAITSGVEGLGIDHTYKFTEANAMNRVPAASDLISMVTQSAEEAAQSMNGSQGKKAFRNGLSQALKVHNDNERRQMEARRFAKNNGSDKLHIPSNAKSYTWA